MLRLLTAALLLLLPAGSLVGQNTAVWQIDSHQQWVNALETSDGLDLRDGTAVPNAKRSFFKSEVRPFDSPRKASVITFQQSPDWNNWSKVPNLGPEGASDAPIFLPISDGNYWFFAEHPDLGKGYHAWRSSDMETWEHKGVASDHRWATTAEYADGKIYLYFDKPNDQDPHLVIGENINTTPSWRSIGKVFDDPSHGSDAGVIRTGDGIFHLIYEDWSPVNAPQQSWDSPLAGHVDSPDGVTGFVFGEYPPAIDHRTRPTGEIGTYSHRYTSDQPLEYEVHEPGQDAFGDFTLIQVGERIYLFCDYHPYQGDIRIGYFATDSIARPFEFIGSFGDGHPDPTIGFAEGQFYLMIQRSEFDYVSPGPWVDEVEARAGVDTDGDGHIDHWTGWLSMSESYRRKPGFARVVEVTPAEIDLTDLPAGIGFGFEFRTDRVTDYNVQPIIDSVTMSFGED
ncbi:MAG: hypothetical protein HKN43_12450 [Rhodothermales bacterium]|nr:hypothetical protein [Rhodothermales bacterium]